MLHLFKNNMKKIFILSVAMFCTRSLYSQLLSGDVVESHRPLLTETDFTIKGSKEGYVVYELAVDTKGNVTSETLVSSMTNIVSTPMKLDAKNMVHKFKFKEGPYLKFQHVKVKITFVK
jgi:hypothetical protein